MELKDYQSRVLDDLSGYINTLERVPNLAEAFRAYWDEKGATRMEDYKNNVPGVPHVCAKVPTAGGKTYIAVNALERIFSALGQHNPKRPKMVVWLVPSLAILEQTVSALADPQHPYRRRLDQLFRKRVNVYHKSDLLMGASFSADTAKDQLSIVVMSFDSLRARNKEDRKIFQENGYLASFADASAESEEAWLLPDYDPSALINVIRSLRPVVIVDESHNAESTLSIEMLQNLHPDFIFDLTATPRNNSNIISYVDAMALKRQHMVKLPVIVANRTKRSEVIDSALILRRQLEQLAKTEELSGGKYIRPIVLFQAQPKTGDDNVTFEKVREALIELKIPAEQIAIKTSKVDELKGRDLMSRDCPVRYIITVNALKEGWDCPFAYILASLADKTSAVDVEQVLGRVLRMPHVQQHGHDLLNLSYVFTASQRFMDTLQSIVKGLNRAGFSDRDYRTIEQTDLHNQTTPPHSIDDLFGASTVDEAEQSSYGAESDDTGESIAGDIQAASPDWHNPTETVEEITSGTSESYGFIDHITQQAAEENRRFESKADANDTVPPELEEKMNRHHIKELFKDDVNTLKLPQFFIEVETGGWFDDDQSLQLLEREELLKSFQLAQADATISFEDVDAEMYRVDLERIGEDDYAPRPFKVQVRERSLLNDYILAGSHESQINNLTSHLSGLIGKMYPLTDQELKEYIGRIVASMTPEQIQDCLERDVAYIRKIKQKIATLANNHAQKAFIDLLDVDRISIQPHFVLPQSITPSANASALPKSLYVSEAAMGQFESRVINDIANLENIAWWHRNLSRGKGLRLNGFINHYPDFILKTKRGRIVVLETKGDDRDNSDSEQKLKLGKLWEAKAGSQFRYMMVFEHNPINGAERLSDALRKLEQL